MASCSILRACSLVSFMHLYSFFVRFCPVGYGNKPAENNVYSPSARSSSEVQAPLQQPSSVRRIDPYEQPQRPLFTELHRILKFSEVRMYGVCELDADTRMQYGGFSLVMLTPL